MASLILGYIFCASGQKVKDESENLYKALCKCEWNEWNERNRMALQMILRETAEPLGLTCLGLWALDYELIKKVVRTTYSLATLFINFK
ncbi:hypothetical protein JTB14_033309 [Gonioctena quinquepunctata]|nr:hypothetical protein JTB14_033309 [Gonioctena quinquepunctata]